MTVIGLEENGYLINNPINVLITAVNSIRRLELSITNLQNGKSATLPNLYPNSNNEIVINLEKTIKGLFTEPKHNENYLAFSPIIIPNNANRIILNFNLDYVDGTKEPLSMQKTFIRGGKFTDQPNQRLASNIDLKITPISPYFAGYPFATYTINNDYKILKYNLNVPAPQVNDLEILREKSCSGKYLKFLNSMGGYSYWLFDNYENEATNSNLGIVNNGFDKKDLGNEYNSSFKVFGKIPARFYLLMRDLILSPEIYEWRKDTQTWKRIYSDGNKWNENGAKVAYKVEYKFNDFTNYNPSLL